MRRPAAVLLAASLVAAAATACSKSERSAAARDAGASGAVGDAFGTGSPSAAPAPGRARRMAGDMGRTVDAAVAASAELAAPPPVADAPLAQRVSPSASQSISRATDTAMPSSSQSELLGRTMVIRTGTAVLEVGALDSAITRARLLALRLGGYVGNTVVQGGKDQPRTATLELKLPASRFDEAVSGLQPLGKVESVNVTAEDVSEEYVDVAARVANARRLEEQLVRLLERRTGKLSDALDVERELGRVREEIERYEGRMRWLRTRASVSTLSVSLHEPIPLIARQPGENPIRDAFVQAWRTFVEFVAGAIASLGVLIPLGLIVLALWSLWRRFGPSLAPRPVAREENRAA